MLVMFTLYLAVLDFIIDLLFFELTPNMHSHRETEHQKNTHV